MYEANSAMAGIIFFPFSIIFFFILLNMFLGIVMSSYEALRSKTQNKTEANARIAEEEGKEWTRKLFNLLLCVVPGTEEPDKPKNKNKKKVENNDDDEVKHDSN